MNKKEIGTDWEIRVEGLTFCADRIEMEKWVDSYKNQVEIRGKARAQETPMVEAHETSTKKIKEAQETSMVEAHETSIEKINGASPTPEKATGGRGEADKWPRTAAGILLTPVNWGAITPDRVCKDVEDCSELAEPANAELDETETAVTEPLAKAEPEVVGLSERSARQG